MDNENADTDFACKLCGKQMDFMKRCTRCRMAFYCSRECQKKDWAQHRDCCDTYYPNLSGLKSATSIHESVNTQQTVEKQAADIFLDDDSASDTCESVDSSFEGENMNTFSTPRPVINFSLAIKNKAFSCKRTESVDNADSVTNKNSYLYKNEIFTDLPSFDVTQPHSVITVKCNKEKIKVPVQNSWTGQEVYKWLSHKLKIPLEKIKVIHKGKVLNSECIAQVIVDKAIFQVIGEQAASEDGIDQRDIGVMMKQLRIDRNTAIKTLRESNDLVDAMLNFSNK